MKELSPVKVVIVCFLFLAIISISSFLDFALTGAIIGIIILYSLPSVWLFLATFVSFILYLIFNFLGLKFDFVGDLSISSYLLFASGLILYFIQGKKKEWQLLMPFAKKLHFSQTGLIKFGGILLFIFLIYPLTNGYLASIVGYVAFLVVFKKSDCRYAFAIALFFLVLCPLFLLVQRDTVAEKSAIFTYYFLVVGTIQEIINLVRLPKMHQEGEKGWTKLLLHSQRIKLLDLQSDLRLPKAQRFYFFKGSKVTKILMSGIFLFIISIVFYLIFNLFFQKGTRIPAPPQAEINLPTIVSSPSPSVSKEELTVKVSNGTLVNGLAASTAARLKEDGFKNIAIGNADKKDYKTWEVVLKSQDENLLVLLKKVLSVENLVVKQASDGAQFDIDIIAGEAR